MPIDVSSSASTCYKCGTPYPKRKGIFPISYAPMWKGVGYISICKECLDTMYVTYLSQCNDPRMAVRQVCRKLDLYWSDKVFDMVEAKSTSRSLISRYLAKLNTSAYVGKCYDDTLIEEGMIWNFNPSESRQSVDGDVREITGVGEGESDDPIYIDDSDIEVTDEVVRFWGGGYPNSKYKELEQRRRYWMSKMPDLDDSDVGTEAILRQICYLELDINRDRISGKSTDKNINTLNTLLGSANLKPNQKRDDADSSVDKTPMGVWIWKLENKRPVKEVDPELEDVDGIRRYVTVWLFGHLCKMLNIKNSYSKLYEEEIAKMRVERPEYDEDDDETMLYDIFSNGESVDDGD